MRKAWEYIREYNPLFSYTFFISIAMSILYYMLPLRIEEAFGGIFWVGIAYGIGGLFCLILDIPIGDFSDIVGKKSSIIRSAFVLMAVAFAYSLELNPYQLVLLLVVMYVFDSFRVISKYAYLIETGKRSMMGELYGFDSFINSISWGIGPIIAGLIAAVNPAYAFHASGALILVSLLITFALKEKKDHGIGFIDGVKLIIEKDGIIKRGMDGLGNLKGKALVVAFLSVSLTILDGVIWTVEPIFSKYLDLTITEGGLILASFLLPVAVTSIFGGWAADRLGRKPPLIAGFLVISASLFLFSQSTSLLPLLASSITTAFGMGLCGPAVSALVSDMTPRKHEGRMMGVFAFVSDMSDTASPVLAGLLGSILLSLPFVFVSLLMALCAVVTFIFIPNHPHQRATHKFHEALVH